MRSGSSEIEITSNQVCDMGCDICDRVTRNGNCPPPLVREGIQHNERNGDGLRSTCAVASFEDVRKRIF